MIVMLVPVIDNDHVDKLVVVVVVTVAVSLVERT